MAEGEEGGGGARPWPPEGTGPGPHGSSQAEGYPVFPTCTDSLVEWRACRARKSGVAGSRPTRDILFGISPQ